MRPPANVLHACVPRRAFPGTRQITAMCQSSTSHSNVYNKYIKYLVGCPNLLRPIYRQFPLRLSVCRGLIYINVHTVPSIRPIPCHWTYGRIARVSLARLNRSRSLSVRVYRPNVIISLKWHRWLICANGNVCSDENRPHTDYTYQ